MTDTLTPEKRSRNMATIHSKDTGPEIYLRKLLFAEGYRYRLHVKDVPGHPDLYLPKYHTAIFVHGCFWHRHPNCKYAYTPKSRLEFWKKKFEDNVQRDEAHKQALEHDGIKELVIWECTIKNAQKRDGDPRLLMAEINAFLRSKSQYKEL